MNIFQFLRIFLARWFIVAITTVTAAVGALIVAELVTPRYQAEARVMFNFSKPDPITGADMTGQNVGAWLDVQRELLRGDRVGGYVVDRLGWLSDPNHVQQYQARPRSDTRDFRRWLAQEVNDRTGVELDGSVLRITYETNSALEAKVAVEELRRGYLAESLTDQQAYARKYAERFAAQTQTAKAGAEQAELAKAAYEKETGLVFDGSGDTDSARLSALAAQAGMASVASVAPTAGATPTSISLAEIEARLAQASQTLGQNHPAIIELKRRRDQLQTLAANEQRPDLSGKATAALTQAYEAQKAKVIGDRDKIEHLRQLQSQVELKRDEYRRTAARAAQLTLEATMADTGATPLGPVLLPEHPIFPKKTLMVGGATALGLGLGLALALLLELLNRRVRGVEDLDIDAEIQCIGVVVHPGRARASLPRRLARKLLGRSALGMPA